VPPVASDVRTAFAARSPAPPHLRYWRDCEIAGSLAGGAVTRRRLFAPNDSSIPEAM